MNVKDYKEYLDKYREEILNAIKDVFKEYNIDILKCELLEETEYKDVISCDVKNIQTGKVTTVNIVIKY